MSRFSVWRICDCEILRRYLAKAANQSIVVNACIRVYVVELRVCRCSYENQYATTDRPTDRPTHRPNHAQTHTTAPSPRRASCFLSFQPSYNQPLLQALLRSHLPPGRPPTSSSIQSTTTRTDQLSSTMYVCGLLL